MLGRLRVWWAFVLVAVAAVAMMATVGCSAGSADEKTIREAIVRYNQVLTEGLRTLNMTPMREVATQLQAEDEYIYMSSLAEGGVRVDATLKDLQFLEFSVETTSATVATRETWDYRHYGREDGALLLEQLGLVYDLSYDLEKQADGRWLVSDVRAVTATTTVEPTVIATPTAIAPGQ